MLVGRNSRNMKQSIGMRPSWPCYKLYVRASKGQVRRFGTGNVLAQTSQGRQIDMLVSLSSKVTKVAGQQAPVMVITVLPQIDAQRRSFQ